MKVEKITMTERKQIRRHCVANFMDLTIGIVIEKK